MAISKVLTCVGTPLQEMTTFVVKSLNKYGIEPVKLTRGEINKLLDENIICQQTFELKAPVSHEDEDTVTRVLSRAGWHVEWDSLALTGKLGFTVSLYGYTFHDKAYEHAFSAYRYNSVYQH